MSTQSPPCDGCTGRGVRPPKPDTHVVSEKDGFARKLGLWVRQRGRRTDEARDGLPEPAAGADGDLDERHHRGPVAHLRNAQAHSSSQTILLLRSSAVRTEDVHTAAQETPARGPRPARARAALVAATV